MSSSDIEKISASGASNTTPPPENIYEEQNKGTKLEDDQPVLPPVKPATTYLTVAILCLLVAFGGFVFGWDTGTISGFVNMPSFLERFGQHKHDGEAYLSNVRTGLIVSIFNIGCAIGGVTFGRLGDMYGRKLGLMFVTSIYMIGIVIQIASINSWVQYFIGRIVSGLGIGAISVLSPMFISETSPKQIRGALVSCYQLMITLGIFLGYCTTYGTYHGYSDDRQWRIPLGLCFAWGTFLIVGMSFMPESPRYLIENGRIEEAKKSLATVNKVSPEDQFVNDEVDVIYTALETEKLAGSASWGELFTGKPKIFYRLFVGVMLQSLQQLTGNNYFFYYGTTIFKSVGLNDSYETSIILGIVNFASTFVAFYIMDKLGRRKVLLGGAACMAVCLVIFACVGVKSLYPHGWGTDSSKPAGNAMIVFTCIYIFFFACTWAPGVFVVVSETYPLRIRAKGMAIAQGANWIWGFLIAFFTPFITQAIHFAYGFVFFGCVIFAFFFVFAFVPETKGLTLEDVDEMYVHYTPGLAFLKSKTTKLVEQDELAPDAESQTN